MSEREPLVDEKNEQPSEIPAVVSSANDVGNEDDADDVVMSRKRYLLTHIFLVIFLILALALAIVLIVDAASASDDSGGPPGTTPMPPQPPPVEDFPIRIPEDWNISSNHPREWSLTVNEGTWINLDLSTDRQTIYFDLAGDIWRLPIAGGIATVIKSGVAYDSQPRVSPDGTEIMFTSDESGCDNLWVMELDGSNVRQVTNEPFRFVSNAMWNPSSSPIDDIVAVKWYTSSRSVPAGEIWVFNMTNGDDPISSGGGRRLVGRPNRSAQIGPEEPTFSRDGKYVYYSQSRETQTYSYGKNPHSGIYQIRRIEVETGDTVTITGGNGGAARPIISPNGRKMAFIRRRLFDTALVVRDLEEEREWVVFKPLTFDQQVSSAPAGVYPRFSWSDNTNVIIYADGKLWSINTDSGEATEIEFEAEINLQIAETVIADTQEPNPLEPFDVKVLQNAVSYAGGDLILFNAVGHTYVYTRVNQLTTRLVPERDDFEGHPTVSNEAGIAAHVIWNDTTLATIEIVNLQNTNNRNTLVFERGRYADPSFDAEGNRLVYTRLGADSLSGPFYGNGAGIYIIDVDDEDGEGDFITTGTSAVFSPDGDALWVNRGSGSIVSVSLVANENGERSETQVVRSSYTSEMKVSPNLEWVAFVEFRQVYIQRLNLALQDDDNVYIVTARPEKDDDGEIGEVRDGVIRLSEDGGRFVTWSDDGSILRWLHGNEFFEVDISDVENLDFGTFQQDGQFVEAVRDAQEVIDLSFTFEPEDISENCLIITNAMILTMEETADTDPVEGNLVVIGDRIHDVGPDASAPDGVECTEFDVEGGLLMPGFIDAHAHWGGTTRYFTQQSWEYILNLAFGVTTVHNPSKDTVSVFADAELVKSGLKLGPRIFSTGSILYGAEGGNHCSITTLDDARQFLRNLKKYGAFSAKSYQLPCRSSRQRLLEAARELGMAITPEGGMAPQWDFTMLVDGHTTIEHNIPVAPLHDDWATLFAESGTGYTPTLVVCFGGIAGEDYWYEATNVWNNTRLMQFHPTSTIESASIRVQRAGGDDDYHHFRVSSSCNDINELGGRVMAGAHGQRQGLAFHWELWMLGQGGMSNYRVLRAGTANAAEALNIGEVGKLVEGYMADFVVYDADVHPLDDIQNSEHIIWLGTHGKLFEAATMHERFPNDVPLPPGPELNIPEL